MLTNQRRILFGHDDFRPEFDFLSNFHICNLFIPGFGFWKSVEHFYQAMKSTNINEQEEIRAAKYPAQAKKLGRQLDLANDWEDIKINVMKTALLYKFCEFSSPVLAKTLAMTEDFELCEWAPWDEFWGLGRKGTGKNMLGKLLMERRTEIIERSIL